VAWLLSVRTSDGGRVVSDEGGSSSRLAYYGDVARAVFTLMILEDHSEEAKLMAQNLSPSKVGLINLLLCAGAFVCSGFVPKSAKTTSLRMAMRICAGVLALIWLALLAKPH
jgi:hypothetical protein